MGIVGDCVEIIKEWLNKLRAIPELNRDLYYKRIKGRLQYGKIWQKPLFK